MVEVLSGTYHFFADVTTLYFDGPPSSGVESGVFDSGTGFGEGRVEYREGHGTICIIFSKCA